MFILPFLIVITIVVFVHELGHYIAARAFDVKVKDFAIGFGKELFGKTDKNGTRWKMCLIPFGGYIKTLGDENAASFETGLEKTVSEEELKYSLAYKKPYQKFIVSGAGPFANFVLATLVFFIMSLTFGITYTPPYVGSVVENGIAKKLGILEGDKIISVNGKNISDFKEIKKHIILSHTQNIIFLIERNKAPIEFNVNFGDLKPSERVLGISSVNHELQHVNAIEALQFSVTETLNIIDLTYSALVNMIKSRHGAGSVGGPIRIASESQKAMNNGLPYFMYFIALISINLGFINLIPIPLLDGGSMLINSVEMIVRRKLPNIVYKILYYIGIVVVAGLMLLGIFNDIYSMIFKQ